MRTPLSFDKDTAILLASCCELTYEQYKQNGIFEIPDGFQYVQGFHELPFKQQNGSIYIRI